MRRLGSKRCLSLRPSSNLLFFLEERKEPVVTLDEDTVVFLMSKVSLFLLFPTLKHPSQKHPYDVGHYSQLYPVYHLRGDIPEDA